MRRREFEDLLRIIGDITGLAEVEIVGSQQILGSLSDDELPRAATLSLELDAVLAGHRQAPSVAAQVGPGSNHARDLRVWVDVVSPTTADFPRGWRRRIVRYDRAGSPRPLALCPSVTDLAASKAARLDRNDRDYIAALLAARIVEPGLLRQRIGQLERTSDGAKRRATRWLDSEIKRIAAAARWRLALVATTGGTRGRLHIAPSDGDRTRCGRAVARSGDLRPGDPRTMLGRRMCEDCRRDWLRFGW